MKKMGFIGLGVMGEPMSRHLLQHRGELQVWNRTPGKAADLIKLGASEAESLPALAAFCDLIAMCVSKTSDALTVAKSVADHAKEGTLVIDHSTIEPAGALEIHQILAEKGIRFVDAPITGGSMGAQAGTLTIFLGGAEPDVAEAIEAVKPYSKRAERVGGPGKGQWMKLANQIAVGAALGGLCECLAFAEKAGLDLTQAKEMIGAGAGGSWAFEFYGPKVLARDWKPGFSITNQLKDFGYCATAATEVGARLPVVEVVQKMLLELANEGRGEQTTAALFELYEK